MNYANMLKILSKVMQTTLRYQHTMCKSCMKMNSSVNMNLYTPLGLEWCPLADLVNDMKANLQRERGRKRASYLLNYSKFAPDKTFIISLISKKVKQVPSLTALHVL